MDDESVYRRFFVVSDLIREILRGGEIRQPTSSPVVPQTPYAEESTPAEGGVPPHLGSNVMSGTRATPSTTRTRQRTQESSKPSPVDRYKFPS